MKYMPLIIFLFFAFLLLLVAIDSIPKAHSRAFGLRGAAIGGAIGPSTPLLVNTGVNLLVDTGIPLRAQ